MNNYTIYAHISPSGKYYIGLTKESPKKRWNRGKGYKRQVLFYRAILKYGWDNFEHKIILSNVSKSEADYAEKYLIKWYKMHDISYNITDGGEGTTGYTPTQETKDKISKSLKGHTAHNRGVSPSKETRQKISNSLKGRKNTESQIKARIKKITKKILQFDYDGKILIKEWESLAEAARYYNIRSSGIGKCCLHLKRHAAGFTWEYSEEKDKLNCSLEPLKSHKKKVTLYSLDGEFIKVWNSVEEAASYYNVAKTGISACARGIQQTSKGYIWKYE